MKETKISKIRAWLEDGRVISQILAIQMFECMDLKNIIYKLRKNGVDIKSVVVNGLTQYYIEQE